MSMNNLSNAEYKHILQCKDQDCFFCGNLYQKEFGRINQDHKSNHYQLSLVKQKRYGWNAELDEKLIMLRKEKLSYAKIGKLIGKSKISVYQRYKRLEKK